MIAFSAHFPQMVDGKVGLIGSCGVMPVSCASISVIPI